MTADQMLVDAVLRTWKFNVDRVEQSFSALTEQQLETRVAPGRNRMLYLLGHIAAVHDRMLPLLGVGDRRHPELDAMFLEKADSGSASPVPMSVLKDILADTNRALWAAFTTWTPTEWLSKHAAVSDADFAKEPHRNRMSVLLSRNSHLAFHHGQILLTEVRR